METVTIKKKEVVEKPVTYQLPYYFQIADLDLYGCQLDTKSCMSVQVKTPSIRISTGTQWLEDKDQHSITQVEFMEKYQDALEIIKGAVL